ncbi:MAG: prolyl oligopeptidase family serine peptidase [Acidobacteria bacterium]|nr:prolyl oligopeptidase family serine peptidase [Bryobacteraceae bacterium CoA2 C42]
MPRFLNVLAQGVERGRQLLAGQAPWTTHKSRRLHGYLSALDGSVQPYALRLPASYDPAKPARLYVWLHGRHRARKVTPSPSNPADDGQIQLDVYGRWNGIAYHWAGEVDVFEAIAAVQSRYKIDPNRILLRGFSMGGCGAWHIALQHPGAFAAAAIGAGTWPSRSQLPGFPPYLAGPLRIYEKILDWSLNAFNLPIAGHGRENESGTSSIPPPPAPRRHQNPRTARKLPPRPRHPRPLPHLQEHRPQYQPRGPRPTRCLPQRTRRPRPPLAQPHPLRHLHHPLPPLPLAHHRPSPAALRTCRSRSPPPLHFDHPQRHPSHPLRNRRRPPDHYRRPGAQGQTRPPPHPRPHRQSLGPRPSRPGPPKNPRPPPPRPLRPPLRQGSPCPPPHQER